MSKVKRSPSAASRHSTFGTLQRGKRDSDEPPADERPLQPVHARGQLERRSNSPKCSIRNPLSRPCAGRHRALIAPVGESPLPVLAAFAVRREYDRRRDVMPRLGRPANQQTSHASKPVAAVISARPAVRNGSRVECSCRTGAGSRSKPRRAAVRTAMAACSPPFCTGRRRRIVEQETAGYLRRRHHAGLGAPNSR